MSRKAPSTTGTPTTPQPKEGRENNGQFGQGNPGGPGNPFARQVAALRKALITAVTEKDMADIARKLIARATSGDVAAARLLLSYAIGKPSAAPNPDRMDVEELQHVQSERELFSEMHKLQMTPEIELAVNQVRCTRPVATRTYCNRMLQGLREMDEADRERQRQMALSEAARSTNGSNGGTGQGQDLDHAQKGNATLGKGGAKRRKESPSTNGSNGDGKC
jgi:hypothetical protein